MGFYQVIPVGMYWAIVTLRTVGLRRHFTQSHLLGQVVVLIMLLGYAIIAVPLNRNLRNGQKTHSPKKVEKFKNLLHFVGKRG